MLKTEQDALNLLKSMVKRIESENSRITAWSIEQCAFNTTLMISTVDVVKFVYPEDNESNRKEAG